MNNHEIIQNLLFSYFNPPVNNKEPQPPEKNINLHELFALISGEEFIRLNKFYQDAKDKQRFKKLYMPYITPHATFVEKRAKENLHQLSGLFVADLDKIPDPEKLKQTLTCDKIIRPVFAFTSPSGKGVKALYFINPSLVNITAKSSQFIKVYECLNNYFIQTYGFGTNPLNELHKRHLQQNGNHHPDLLSFASAAMTAGESAETIKEYVSANVAIDKDSHYADDENKEKLNGLMNDIKKRYFSDENTATKLSETSFYYDIFLFRYNKGIRSFQLEALYWNGVLESLHEMEFFKRYDSTGKTSVIIQQKDNVIDEFTSEILRDCINEYVKSFDKALTFSYQQKNFCITPEALCEVFLRNSNSLFNQTWLEHLQIHKAPVLRDTRNEIYFVFQNCLVTVTADSIDKQELSEIENYCVWKSQQIERNFTYVDGWNGHFATFLKNVTGDRQGDTTKENKKNLQSLCSALGYIMHYHFKPSEGQAVILYDKVITDIKTPMGGTGKGLIAHALSQVRSIAKVDGKHYDEKNRFRNERINLSTQVIWFDDVKPDFDFSLLNSCLTDGWTVERKNLAQIFIPPQDSPKTLICSNTILKGTGITIKRRQFVFELGDHYSKHIKTGLEKPIAEEHGGEFFSDAWKEDEWNAFYSVMLDCCKIYLQYGLIPQPTGNVEKNKLRQQTSDDFVQWCEEQEFILNEEYNQKEKFTEFKKQYYGEDSAFFQKTFIKWLRHYAEFMKWTFKNRKSNSEYIFRFEKST